MYSFDIFDTLVTRRTATPKGIFAIMQDAVLSDVKYSGIPFYIRRDFYQIRVLSEKAARNFVNAKGLDEVTLKEIYMQFQNYASLPETQIEALMNLEIEIEQRNLLPIVANIQRLKELIGQGEHVVLVSDIYHTEDVIRSFLCSIDQVFHKVKLYLSSSYGKMKASGALFEIVRQAEGKKADTWIHIGDNFVSDVQNAQKYGIICEPFNFEPLYDFEKKILGENKESFRLELMVGAARNVRLLHSDAQFKNLGLSIGAPMMYQYVEWILNKCAQESLKYLYFVARDGYLLKKIADLLIKKRKLKIQTAYIYGSRAAWRLIETPITKASLDEKFIEMLHAKVVNLSDYARIFHVPLEQLAELVPSAYADTKRILSFTDQLILEKSLAKNSRFLDLVQKSNKEQAQLALCYLKQNVRLDCADIAFVESNGSGYTQHSLTKILAGSYDYPIKTFYYELNLTEKFDNCIYYSYIPTVVDYSDSIELFCRAPHSQTLRYQSIQGEVRPVLDPNQHDRMPEKLFLDMQDGILEFAEHAAESMKQNGADLSEVKLVLEYMDMIAFPDMQVADFIGDLPFSTFGSAQEDLLFAPRLSDDQLQLLYRYGDRKHFLDVYKGNFLDYSLKRCTQRDWCVIRNYMAESGGNGEILQAGDIDPQLAARFLGKNVVLYGAGILGKKCAHFLQHHGYTRVLWADSAFQKFQNLESDISDPAKIAEVSYDHILIAISKPELVWEVKEKLICAGAGPERIVWVNQLRNR